MTVAVQLRQFLIRQKQILNLLSVRNYSENHFTVLTFVCYGAKNYSKTFRHFNEKTFMYFMFLFGKIVHGTYIWRQVVYFCLFSK